MPVSTELGWQWPSPHEEAVYLEIYGDLLSSPKNFSFPFTHHGISYPLHIYIMMHKVDTSKCGVWIWSGSQRKYIHFTGRTPIWWKPISKSLDDFSLDELNGISSNIDEHINALIESL